MRTKPTPLKGIVPSPREIAWWFCLPVDRRSTKHREHLQFLQETDREWSSLYNLAQAFFRMIREHSSSQLSSWVEEVEECLIPELRGFARGLGRDESAIW
jgi:transposase